MNINNKIKETIAGKKTEEIKHGNKTSERMPDTKESMEGDAQKQPIIEQLKMIEDPELGIDIWTLGLIYNIEVREKEVDIRMTFTSIMCPVGPMIVQSIKDKLNALESVDEVNVEVTFTPMWGPTDELREMLGV